MEKVLTSLVSEIKYKKDYWDYYLLLENNFFELNDYVCIDKDNFKTFSTVYLKLLLSVSSEFDVICKKLCKMLDNNLDEDACGITDYITIFNEKLSNLYDKAVFLQNENMTTKPLHSMKKNFPPAFWDDYNKIKHHRADNNFQRANLKNVSEALCALYLVERLFVLLNATNISDDFYSINAFNSVNFKSKKIKIEIFDDIRIYEIKNEIIKIQNSIGLIQEIKN